jgi:hypothetical protein
MAEIIATERDRAKAREVCVNFARDGAFIFGEVATAIANARAEERERCVKVVREITERLSVYGVPFWAQLIEKAIRNGE